MTPMTRKAADVTRVVAVHQSRTFASTRKETNLTKTYTKKLVNLLTQEFHKTRSLCYSFLFAYFCCRNTSIMKKVFKLTVNGAICS